jgi:ribosomal protein S18 acetylase RimI-like enzyme
VSTTPFAVRSATPADLAAIGHYAADLVRLHHRFDADRFFLPESIEAGYVRFLQGSIWDANVVLLVAEEDDRVVGYAYGRMEPRDWNALLDAHGALHDVYVDNAARGRSIGQALVAKTIAALRSKGARRIVVQTAAANGVARQFFEKLGFRTTMIEMTLSG